MACPMSIFFFLGNRTLAIVGVATDLCSQLSMQVGVVL